MLLGPIVLLMLLSLCALGRWPSWLLLFVVAAMSGLLIGFSVMMLMPRDGEMSTVVLFTAVAVGIYLLLGSCVIWLARTAQKKRGS